MRIDIMPQRTKHLVGILKFCPMARLARLLGVLPVPATALVLISKTPIFRKTVDGLPCSHNIDKPAIHAALPLLCELLRRGPIGKLSCFALTF